MTADEAELLGLVKDEHLEQHHCPQQRRVVVDYPYGDSAKVGMNVFGCMSFIAMAGALTAIAAVMLAFAALVLFPTTGRKVFGIFHEADKQLYESPP